MNIAVEHGQEEVQDGLDGGELSTQMRGKVRQTRQEESFEMK